MERSSSTKRERQHSTSLESPKQSEQTRSKPGQQSTEASDPTSIDLELPQASQESQSELLMVQGTVVVDQKGATTFNLT